MATSCNVRVIARFRPFNQRELGLGCDKVHTIQGEQRVDIHCDGHPKRSFAFDQVFGEDSRQRDVYSILQVSRDAHAPARPPALRLSLGRSCERARRASAFAIGRGDSGLAAADAPADVRCAGGRTPPWT